MEIKKIVVGPISANCYLIISDSELAVIDPGDEAVKILSEINKISAKAIFIINTHYHFDHTLANEEIKKTTGAKILIHQAERDYIDFAADIFLENNEIIRIGKTELKSINTPGHTKGSICLFGENFIFTGDTLFAGACGRTDLPGGSDEEMEYSLKMLSGIIKPGMKVYPGHGQIYTA